MTATVKKHRRLIINAAMILFLALLYNVKLLPLLFHEAAGIAVFFLFAVHVVINRKWRAKPAERAVTIALGLAFFAALVTGIVISHELFTWANKASPIWQTLHLLAALAALILAAGHGIQHRKSLLAFCRRPIAKKAVARLLLAATIFLVCRTGAVMAGHGHKTAGQDPKPGQHDGFVPKEEERK